MAKDGYSLAICFPVWNRGDLFEVSYASLLRQLDGIDASIWIFDNGSDEETRAFIHGLESAGPRLFKIFLPQNMGIPYVINVFSQFLTQDCDYVDYQAPEHVMIADADAYFKKPVRDMIEILERGEFTVLSGHDSVEHETLGEMAQSLGWKTERVKVKAIERGLCLLTRKETLARCVPFPHDTNMNVDWSLLQWHPNSLLASNGRLGVVDYVAHIGLYDSTHHSTGVPANGVEVVEINDILVREGLLTPARQARMKKFCRDALNPEYQNQFKPSVERRW